MGLCWECLQPDGASATSLAVPLRFDLPSNMQVIIGLRKFGHVWALVEKLYFCTLLEQRRAAERGAEESS